MSLTYIPFDLPGKIYRSPMPFARFDYDHTVFQEYLEAGIDSVVMLIEEGEDLELAGQDLKSLYAQNGIDVIHYSIVDFGTPEDSQKLEDHLEIVLDRVKQGEHIAVHCFAGQGRTGMFLALLARRILKIDGDQAISFVRQYFQAVETEAQQQIVIDYQIPE
ncbi:MAG: protein-tyrosine phosphatase family protein [Chloroflexota bacterium]